MKFQSPEKARNLSVETKSVCFTDHTVGYYDGEYIKFEDFSKSKQYAPWSSYSKPISLGAHSIPKDSLLSSISDFVSKQGHKLRPPPWFIGHSSKFTKIVSNLDKNLKSRVLDAINKIQKNPLKLIGDTQKPLVGELKGAWRYRIGDYRLVYVPVKEVGNILLVDLDSRGSIY